MKSRKRTHRAKEHGRAPKRHASPLKRARNYKLEYRRRIKRGKAKGLSHAEARGHFKRKSVRPIKEAQFQTGLRSLIHGDSPATAASKIHVSRKRFLDYAFEKGFIEKRGKKWRLKKRLLRRVLIYSGGRPQGIMVDEVTASFVGEYMAAMRWFTTTHKESYRIPFIGKSVADIYGKIYPLETRPNVIHRLAHSGGTSFEQVYTITV